jgi:hypothetical protein
MIYYAVGEHPAPVYGTRPSPRPRNRFDGDLADHIRAALAAHRIPCARVTVGRYASGFGVVMSGLRVRGSEMWDVLSDIERLGYDVYILAERETATALALVSAGSGDRGDKD